jgi:hypothetical protein
MIFILDGTLLPAAPHLEVLRGWRHEAAHFRSHRSGYALFRSYRPGYAIVFLLVSQVCYAIFLLPVSPQVTLQYLLSFCLTGYVLLSYYFRSHRSLRSHTSDLTTRVMVSSYVWSHRLGYFFLPSRGLVLFSSDLIGWLLYLLTFSPRGLVTLPSFSGLTLRLSFLLTSVSWSHIMAS